MHNLTDEAAPHRMLSFTPKPVPSWDNRPAVSSPLSSSPVRASSPHSAAEEVARWQPRQVQSSPIRPNSFKFQSRPARPNPVMKKREELQEQRRKGFLQNVRQKAEDRSWQRRDIEGQFLKTSWLANVGRLSHDAPSFSDADIEDAATFSPEMAQSRMDEDMIPEELMDEEQLLTSYEEEVMAQQGSRLPTLAEDDDEYDDIFAELISQEQERQSLQQQQPHQQHHSSQPSNQMEID